MFNENNNLIVIVIYSFIGKAWTFYKRFLKISLYPPIDPPQSLYNIYKSLIIGTVLENLVFCV